MPSAIAIAVPGIVITIRIRKARRVRSLWSSAEARAMTGSSASPVADGRYRRISDPFTATA